MRTRLEAAAERAAGGYAAVKDRPSQRRCALEEDAPAAVRVDLTRASLVREVSGGDVGDPHVQGMASITERAYVMYDMFGEYEEVIAADAFDKTLAANPLVEFTLNHNRGGGAPMAHTRNGTLVLSVLKDVDDPGLHYDAHVDDSRNDVSDMVKALDRGDLAEASFKFRILNGEWSPDYMMFRITEVDLHRGDVSAVNFGANPSATSALRDEPAAPAAAKRSIVERRSLDDDIRHRTL